MAKVSAPLLGFSAAGQIGKTQVYGTWRGVPYARKHVIPANPKTSAQTQTRGTFNFINQVWKSMNAAVQGVWTASAKGMPLTDRNAFIKANLPAWRGTTLVPATDLSGGTMSPGVNAGLAAAGLVTSDGGTHHLVATISAPDLPAGWTITKAHAIAIKQQDAQTGTDYTSFYANDATAPYAPSINVGAADTYACWAFFEYAKPDGSVAYSPALYSQQVVA